MTLKKHLVISASLITVFVAVMGFLHTPQGLNLWGRLRGSSACPLGMDAHSSPEARDAHRAAQANQLRGEGRARSTQAFGFELGRSTRQDVAAWTRKTSATCNEMRVSMAELECKVPAAKGSADKHLNAGTVFFMFDARGTLKGVHTMTNFADAAAAADAFVQSRERASQSLGHAPAHSGEASGSYLAAYPLRQVAAEYRLEDVYTRLSATHNAQAYIVEENWRMLVD